MSKMCSICVGQGCDFCSSDYFKKPRCFDGNFANLHMGVCPGDYFYAYEISNADAICSNEPKVDMIAIIIAVVVTLSCCGCMCGIIYFKGWGALSCGLVKEREKVYVDNTHGVQGGMPGQYPMQGGMPGQYPMQGGMPMGQIHPQHTSSGFGGGVQMQPLPVYAHQYTEGQNIPHAEVVHAIPVGMQPKNTAP